MKNSIEQYAHYADTVQQINRYAALPGDFIQRVEEKYQNSLAELADVYKRQLRGLGFRYNGNKPSVCCEEAPFRGAAPPAPSARRALPFPSLFPS